MPDTGNWGQGQWNAHVVFDITIEESRERCRNVPPEFKQQAIQHARTYWAIQQVQKPEPRKATQHQPVSYAWPVIEITPDHWEQGRAHLAGANWKLLEKFGDQELGFAAEYAVEGWLLGQGADPNHNPDPKNTNPDFTINGTTIDLKSRQSVTPPRLDYDGDLADRQRRKDQEKGTPDWYLFGYWNNRTNGEYHIMGMQTPEQVCKLGVFYQKGERTQGGMTPPVDCWCIEYRHLILPAEWLRRGAV